MRTVIHNGTLVTMNALGIIHKHGYLAIENQKISEIGPVSQYQFQEGDVIVDASNTLVIPGLINAHTHLGMIPFRSMADDMPDRLRRFLFPMEQEFMNEALVQASTYYAAMESIQSGTTTVADMYYFEDIVASTLEETGLRAFCGQTLIEEHACDAENEADALRKTEAFLKKWRHHSRIYPMIAPHGTNTVTSETLRQAADMARQYEVKMMMHVSEMDYEMKYFKEQYEKTPVEYLESIGVLGDHFIAVHCIHTTPHDHQILKKHHSSVVHCVGANMKSGKGIMDLKDMNAKQLAIGLGTDGPVSGNTLDMFTPMKTAAMAQKTKYHDRALITSKEIFSHATIEGARALGIDACVGSLEIGKEADVVLIDTSHSNMFPLHDIYAALVYSAQPHNVRDVMVQGKWLMRHREMLSMNENVIRKSLQALMKPVSEKYKTMKSH